MTRYHIGTSGWHYEDWRERFYPEKLPKANWLEFYSRYYSTVELNNTFYQLPSEAAFTKWYNSSPASFIFAVKVSRYITHIKRLKDCEEAVDKFIAKATILKDKLGPLLYQLPPSLKRDDDRLAAFLAILPSGQKQVIEFRHPSWFMEEVYDLLRRHHTGFCVYDLPGFTSPIVATSDFAYVRFHGRDSRYSSLYPDKEMAEWAQKITALVKNLEAVYIYFNNDVSGHALDNSKTIQGYLTAASD